MKNTINPFSAIAFFALVFSFLSLNCTAQDAQRIRVIFGTRVHPSSDGKGCEGDKGTCLIVSYGQKGLPDNPGVAEISVKDEFIEWNIIEDDAPASDFENAFHVYEPKEIPRDVCRQLGYSRIVLQPGEYRLDKSENRLGKVLIKAEIN